MPRSDQNSSSPGVMFCGLCHISVLPYYRFAVSFGMFGMFQRFAPSPAAVAFALPIIQGAQSFFAGPHPKAGRGYGGVWGEAIIIQLVLCIFLGVRAVKGADADEVLFVG